MNKRPHLWLAIYLTVVVVWGALSYETLFDYMHQGILFARVLGGKPYLNDFVNTYSAANLARRCLSHRIDVYDPQLQDAAVRKLVAPVVPENPFYFQYPPHYFAMVLPLSFLSLPAAWIVWNVVWLSACVCALRFLTKELPRRQSFLLIGVGMSAFPWWMSTQLGQTALLVFPLTVLFFHQLRIKRFALAALAAAIMSIKLQYLPAFALIGSIAGGLPFLAVLALAAGALVGLATLVLGWGNVVSFPHALAMGETGRFFTGVNPFVMQNVRGEVWLLFHGEHAGSRYISIAVFIAATLFIGWLWWRFFLPAARRTTALYVDARLYQWLASVSILLMIITSLHTHVQDYILATIPCVWMWLAQTESRMMRWLILAMPMASWFMFFLQTVLALVFIQPYFLWAVCLLAAIINEKRRYTQPAPGDQ